ncbi:hypothetical protein [Litoreibacter albidus]|uniref:Uncharacterized protein n=1 Tax=Litoreibacter albidus TaxID=670155 RepID=A0A1H2XX54_9RHOB|nr:hypothetical protein [Litoreibacter albidus]SDW97446.1 hypothetical protein SAMN04488001_2138 [Litoreibacter albidus]
MSDYTTPKSNSSSTGLVVAAVLIGLFIVVIAMLGSGTVTEGDAIAPPENLDAPAITAPAADG